MTRIHLVSREKKNSIGAAFERLEGGKKGKKNPAPAVVLDKNKLVKLTPERRRLAELLSENLGKPGGPSIEAMMLEAGFSPSTAKQQSTILGPMRESGVFDPLIEDLNKRIEWCTKAMTNKKIGKQSPYTNALTADLLIKNRELLAGRGGLAGNVTFNFNHNQSAYFTKVVKKGEEK